MNFNTNQILIYLGGIVTSWVVNKLLDTIPNYLGYRIRYNYKSLIKWINNNIITVCFSYKIMEPPLTLGAYKDEVKTIFLNEKFNFLGEKGNNLMFNIKYSDLDLEITTIPSYHQEQEVIKIDTIELNIKMNTNFRSFKDDINDIYKFKDDVYGFIIPKKYDRLKNLSTTFYLGGMYKLTGILKDINLNHLYGQLGNNQVDLFDNKIIVYDRILKDELVKIKRIITYYY